MTNFRSDTLITRRIARAFIDFLDSVEPAPGVDGEGLEVVKDCLSEFFQLNQLSANDQPEPNLLINLFSSCERSRVNEHKPGISTPAPTAAVVANSSVTCDHADAKFQGDAGVAGPSESGVSVDELFGQFFAALEKFHFFRSTPGGDDEHVLLDRVTSLFHDAINEMQTSGCKTFDQKSLAEALKTLGNKAMQSKIYADAIERYTCAIALCENAVYYSNRAAAYTQIGKYDEAVRDCVRATEIDPTYSKAYSRLGFAYYSQGSYSDAINKGFKKALELDPNNSSVKDSLQAAEQKLREQQERRGHNQFAGGSGSWAGPPPFASMSFDAGAVPANLASMFANMPFYTHQNPSEEHHGAPPPHASMAFNVDLNGIFGNAAPNPNQHPDSQTGSTDQTHEGERAPPFRSMPFDPTAIPPNIADMFMNMGHNPQGDNNTEGNNINMNFGGLQIPEELIGNFRSAMGGVFSPGSTQGGQPGPDNGRPSSN